MIPGKLIAIGKPGERMVDATALLVAGVFDDSEAAALAGVPASALLDLLGDPDVQQAIDSRLLRWKLDGTLANVRAEKLTMQALERIEAEAGAVSVGIAIKIAELGLKFRERPEVSKAPDARTEVVIINDGDPEPLPPEPGVHRYVIRLGTAKADAALEGEVIAAEASE
ncbi:MAG: hypothetical protein ACM3SV_03615 [Betaproteobacteria bacterium]